ncbi:acetolactate synthase, small subunit [Desulfarculus baarsii DSM 2075]|uniref:Acetolactate synthase small subunit n=1 Tax=Desulfarculus baarsii (strain ATCC 33931 / DSM 2075 / LMG 7858 / VKM B-1802 / 2st14) TaxID=644282 RepID=E1QDS7_DESB2|nr:acetolactate synthase small subunit [Desulfarculus baarsii]ADK83713.1 acetolactate synthase, small subunit [Desulfarculus baarsii DSM 2075]
MSEEYCPISVLVRNEPGVLARVAGLFARRGFNINSLAVGETEDPQVSRITVVVKGDPHTVDQAVKQLRRLVSVIKVRDQSTMPRVERGLALIKVRATPAQRGEIMQLAGVFRANVDHVDGHCMVIEVSGNRNKIEAMIDMLKPYGIMELARTGQIVLARVRSIHQGMEGAGSAYVPDPDEDPQATYNVYQQS